MADVVDSTGWVPGFGSQLAGGNFIGATVSVNNDCKLISITKISIVTCDGFKVYKNSDKSLLATSAMEGDVATFSLDLSAGEEYCLVFYSESVCREYHDNSPGYPVNGTNINFISWAKRTPEEDWDTSGTTRAYNILSVTTEEIAGVTDNAIFMGCNI